MAVPGLYIVPGSDPCLQGLKGTEQEHKQDDKKPASLLGKACTAGGQNSLLQETWLGGEGKQQKAWLSLRAFLGTVLAPASAQVQARVQRSLPAPSPRRLHTQPVGETTPASCRLAASLPANARHPLGNHRELHLPNLMLLHKWNCSHVKDRAAEERASCFGVSRARVASGQKAKAHMERKGKSIHRFRLLTVLQGHAVPAACRGRDGSRQGLSQHSHLAIP